MSNSNLIKTAVAAIMLFATLPIVAENEYTLVWNQDFTGEKLPECWNIESNGNGGGNNELQYYCGRGVSVGTDPVEGKHCLILTATKEIYAGKKCTSGRVNTMSNTYFTYGKIEARIWFPNTADGLWPAFWMMGNDYPEVNWPKCGETDIIELGHQNGIAAGTQDRYFNGAMHNGNAWNDMLSVANNVTWDYSVEDTFHIITCEWTPTQVTMYMDKDAHPENEPYFVQQLDTNDDPYKNRQTVFGKPNFILLNLAVGGNFPGMRNINEVTAIADAPAHMYIDWVRVYQRGDEGETFTSNVASDPIEGEEVEGIRQNEISKATKAVRHNNIVIVRDNRIFDILGNQL